VKKKKKTLMVWLLMPLKKTVGYGPIIEPMIEDKIMKLAINEKKTRKSMNIFK